MQDSRLSKKFTPRIVAGRELGDQDAFTDEETEEIESSSFNGRSEDSGDKSDTSDESSKTFQNGARLSSRKNYFANLESGSDESDEKMPEMTGAYPITTTSTVRPLATRKRPAFHGKQRLNRTKGFGECVLYSNKINYD